MNSAIAMSGVRLCSVPVVTVASIRACHKGAALDLTSATLGAQDAQGKPGPANASGDVYGEKDCSAGAKAAAPAAAPAGKAVEDGAAALLGADSSVWPCVIRRRSCCVRRAGSACLTVCPPVKAGPPEVDLHRVQCHRRLRRRSCWRLRVQLRKRSACGSIASRKRSGRCRWPPDLGSAWLAKCAHGS